MPLYLYKALNTRGEVLDGQMEAGSDGEVVSRLQEQGHLPIEARLASEVAPGSSLKALAGETTIEEVLRVTEDA